MAAKPTEAQEARALARRLIDQVGKLRVPGAKADKLEGVLEEIAQRLIDMASRMDAETNNTS